LSTNEIRAQEGWNPLPDASANSHDPLNQSPQAAGSTTPAAPAPPPKKGLNGDARHG
jgi:hypothetical protein